MKDNTAVSQILTNFNLQGPAALLSYSTDIGHRVGQVRGERSIDVGLQLLEDEVSTVTVWVM